MKRIQWRTKQNLDYAYLMMFAQRRGRLYLQMEDDLLTTSTKLVSTVVGVADNNTSDWFDIHFYEGGFIGKLFRQGLPKICNAK